MIKYLLGNLHDLHATASHHNSQLNKQTKTQKYIHRKNYKKIIRKEIKKYKKKIRRQMIQKYKVEKITGYRDTLHYAAIL